MTTCCFTLQKGQSFGLDGCLPAQMICSISDGVNRSFKKDVSGQQKTNNQDASAGKTNPYSSEQSIPALHTHFYAPHKVQ